MDQTTENKINLAIREFGWLIWAGEYLSGGERERRKEKGSCSLFCWGDWMAILKDWEAELTRPGFLATSGGIRWSGMSKRVGLLRMESFLLFLSPPPPTAFFLFPSSRTLCLFLFLSVAASPDKMLGVEGGSFTNIVSDLHLASYPTLGR